MPNGTAYISAQPATTPADETIETVEHALRIVRWLGSPAAADVQYRQRRACAEALASWLADYAEHVEQVEHGCQMLLLQAAEMCGARSQSDPSPRQDAPRRAAAHGTLRTHDRP